MKKTGFVCISDTVRFRHHINPKPTITTTDRVVEATNNLVDILNQDADDIPQTQLEAIEMLWQVLMLPPKQAPTNPITPTYLEEETVNMEKESEKVDN